MSKDQEYDDAKKKILAEQVSFKKEEQFETLKSEYDNMNRDQFEKELTNKYHFKATKDTEDLYYYEYSLSIYVKGGGWLIKRECLKFNPGINTSTVEQIQEHIIWGNYVDRSDFDRDIEWICCKNVMVNLKTGETATDSPDFMETVICVMQVLSIG